MSNKLIKYIDLGILRYDDALEKQKELHNKLIDNKLLNKRKSISEQTENNNFLLFCEHQPVYTLGKSGKIANLVYDEITLQNKGIEFKYTNRGGDITFHGPGQIVGYPIFDLDNYYHDVHRYVTDIEEVIIKSLKYYKLEGIRIEGATGVWIKDNSSENYKKICAIGIHISRWVTMHGFAFNINTDLDFFGGIIPCGIQDMDKSVTSLRKEIGENVNIEDVKTHLLSSFEEVFDSKIVFS